MDALVPLVVGLVLTTVLGGLLGTYLQRRTRDHQHEVQLRQEDLRRAGETVSAEVLAEKFRDYDEVLYEWNDSLNVNLAVVGTYFGQRARDWLEQAYEGYREAGGELEDAYRQMARVPARPPRRPGRPPG